MNTIFFPVAINTAFLQLLQILFYFSPAYAGKNTVLSPAAINTYLVFILAASNTVFYLAGINTTSDK